MTLHKREVFVVIAFFKTESKASELRANETQIIGVFSSLDKAQVAKKSAKALIGAREDLRFNKRFGRPLPIYVAIVAMDLDKFNHYRVDADRELLHGNTFADRVSSL